jgi:hypothetical protein
MKRVGTTLLKNPAGEQFLGISTAFGAPGKLNRRLDPEGVRIAPDGAVWVSDEYGPYILQFDQSGRETGELEAPDVFTIAQPAANAKIEMGSNNIVGRRHPISSSNPDGHRFLDLFDGECDLAPSPDTLQVAPPRKKVCLFPRQPTCRCTMPSYHRLGVNLDGLFD